ncbi:MAG: GAF domain-containing protein, partial [Desulfobacterales bacterium]|nr:GAF domain-containing protein [Desulfobacterales bacterium]
NHSMIVPDVSNDAHFFNGLSSKDNFETRSMICTPLRTRGGVIGVLYALNKQDGIFTERDAQLLDTISGTVAIAIENAQLYGDMKQLANNLEEENRKLKSALRERFNLQGVIGSSPPMRKLFTLMDKVINTTTSVLISGETGTGKELIANTIHYNGPLKNRPFVAENCGALSDSLLESELFGHVKGAFTGAISNKKGIFELADGGTVFLDEIGETSQSMQVKLLRVLQEGQFRPVGGSRSRKVNVRLIASTNRDLKEEVLKGNFREDLYYRINVFPIRLPPLRDRGEDIPFLAAHFLKKYGKKLNRPGARMGPRVVELLARFNWRGNVRELENEIERALTLAGVSGRIKADNLSEKIHMAQKQKRYMKQPKGTLPQMIERIEKQMVTEALRKSKGNRSEAARNLGLTRQGLLNKVSRYNLNL